LMMGKAVALCANARLSFSDVKKHWYITGDPTDAAMVVFAEKMGFRKEDLLNEIYLRRNYILIREIIF